MIEGGEGTLMQRPCIVTASGVVGHRGFRRYLTLVLHGPVIIIQAQIVIPDRVGADQYQSLHKPVASSSLPPS